MARIEVARGSVVHFEADALVNAANTRMRGGGGVDGAFHMACGEPLLQELRRAAPRGAEVAEVVVTSACGLKANWIFHVAGPIWRGGASGEAGQLAQAYEGCIREALRRDLSSIAFPSLSTGAFGFPLEQAARIAIRTVAQAALGSSLQIWFCMFGSREFEVFTSELRRYGDENMGEA